MFSAFQTFGRLGAGARAVAAAWSPLALWPDGVNSPGMWISPSTLDASFNDYTGTTPVAMPGTVADSANPVGLALDIRAGAPETLGPDIVTNGDFATDTGWTKGIGWTISGGAAHFDGTATDKQLTQTALTIGKWYEYTVTATNVVNGRFCVWDAQGSGVHFFDPIGTQTFTGIIYATSTTLAVYAGYGAFSVDNISVKEIPGHHMLQSTSAARPLESAYDGQTLGPGNTYDATGYPIFQLYDGTDDGMATASFAAGTLINGMDCLIAVRRDAGTIAVAGLNNQPQNVFFGIYVQGDNVNPDHGGCGTPTTWVDGSQLTGGTSVTRETLYNALTAGEWHILEYRDLDLSTWTQAFWGNFAATFFVNGARGDIMLYPSTASTTDKDNARQYLADKYGVTLP